MIKTNIQKEILSTLSLLAINVIMFLFLLLFSFSIKFMLTLENWTIYLLSYFTLLITFNFLQKKFNKKIITYIFYVILLPVGIFYIIGTIGIPFIILQFHLFFYLALCFFFPMAIYKFYELLGYFKLSTELQVYLILTVAVMSSIVFQKQVKYIVHALSPARLRTSEKLKPYNIEELSNYLLSENNIKFVVFTIYFIIIITVNLFNFQDSSYYDTEKIDKAVLQSFVTYIAFDRIVSSLKQVEFKPSEMVSKIGKSISDKIEHLESNK